MFFPTLTVVGALVSTSVAGDCAIVASCLGRIPHVVISALSIMTLHSTSDSSSIFENGKLRPGIYKIQNIQSETFLDIEIHTREVCCRPAKDLGEGRGFVGLFPSFLSVSNDQKWEIKRFGAGCTVQVVSPLIGSGGTLVIAC